MKKIFLWIVVLITLSLIGIIYIQVSWIRNAVDMRRDQYDQHMNEVLDRVRVDLVNNRHVSPEQDGSLGLNQGIRGSILKNYFPAQMIAVSDRYSSREVQEIISDNLRREDLKVPFEYAILHTRSPLLSTYELYSPGFFRIARDTMHYKQFWTYLVDDQATISAIMTNMNNELIYILVPADSYTYIMQSMGWIIAGAILFTLIIITAFALTVYTMLRQKKLSEIKSDFINNMTHEFKTPLATISLAVDAIGNGKVIENKEKIRYFTGIIKEENKRMHKQVETILQSALLDRQEISLEKKKINVHELIERNVHNLELQLQDRGGVVRQHLEADNPFLWGDEMHFSNMLSNLMDNALKYSGENPVIDIYTANDKRGLMVAVADNGIGMTKETQSRIFEKFYRAHTGNLHNVKGFGLGLAYVKLVAEGHKGKISVDSTPGKGSRFELVFPAYTEAEVEKTGG